MSTPGELIPEIGREEFTVGRLRSAIGNHGSVLVRGLVGPERVETWRMAPSTYGAMVSPRGDGRRPRERHDFVAADGAGAHRGDTLAR